MKLLIEKYFSKRPEVIAVFLFGSHASHKQRLDSDVDLGILLKYEEVYRADELREKFIVELSRILRKDIHPAIMNIAGEDLLRQILSKGICIRVNDPKRLSQFMLVSLCRIAEFGYYRKMLEKGFLKSLGVPSYG